MKVLSQLINFFCFLLALQSCIPNHLEARNWKLTSPNAPLEIELLISSDSNGPTLKHPFQYRVLHHGKVVMEWSKLGLTFNHSNGAKMDFSSKIEVLETQRRSGIDHFTLPHGKAVTSSSKYNEISLTLANPEEQRMVFRCRAYDDGVSFRYEIQGTGSVSLKKEDTTFKLPSDATGYLQMKDFPGLYAPNYQDPIIKASVGTLSPGNGYVLPGLFSMTDESTWLLIHEAGLTVDYFGAHLDEPTASGEYSIALPNSNEGNGFGSVLPTSELPFNTPWRIIAVGNLPTIVETNLIRHASETVHESTMNDLSWIQPGKVAWSWWSQDTGTPELQYEYIDFAHEFGWEYILIDARWDQWPNAETQIRTLVDYAKERNVRILLWYNSGGLHNSVQNATPRDLMLDPAIRRAEMSRIHEWGVAGIKVDFFFSDKQAQIRQYIEIMEDAMEHELLVNFHGCTVPRGWSRTYPNLMTMESVAGAENYKWRSEPVALQNVRYTFTRNVVGPMDYTPLTFQSALSRAGISYAHQLALSVIFESGLQHFADRADSNSSQGFRALFSETPEIADFLTNIPTTWDESILLDGHPDSHAVWARRSGEKWYIGGISGLNRSLSVEVDLSFIKGNQAIVDSFRQGNMNNQIVYSSNLEDLSNPITVELSSRDGFTMVVTPERVPFDTWLSSNFSDLQNVDIKYDSDEDGIPLLLEYVFGTDPKTASDANSIYPLVYQTDQGWRVGFPKQLGIELSSLEIIHAESPSFDNFSSVDLLNASPDRNGWVSLPITDIDSSFFRLSASR